MDKIAMYFIITVTTTIGAYVPTFWGADAFGGQSIFGSLVGGIAGVWLYWQLKSNGYIE